MVGFKPSTYGEMLYDILVRKFINDNQDLRSSLLSIENFKIGGRKENFADYYTGIFCFNMTARVIQSAKFILKEPNLGDNLHHGNMLNFLCTQLNISEFSFKKYDVNRLVNLSFEAARSARQKISNATKNAILCSHEEFHCYICGREIRKAGNEPNDLIQLEHIWPRRFGGDSGIDNLIPACCDCNSDKDSMLLWQDAHIHSFVLKPYPSADDLRKVPRKAKIAKHRQAICEYSCAKELTLKEAAIEIGPYDFSNMRVLDRDDSADFFTLHF